MKRSSSDQDDSRQIIDAACRLLEAATLVDLVRNHLGRDFESLKQVAGTETLSARSAAECLYAFFGIRLFANREVRHAIVDCAPLDLLDACIDGNGESTLFSDRPKSLAEKRQRIATHPWHPGSSWVRHFCKIFHLPDCAIGIYAEEQPSRAIESVDPYIPLRPLHDFQIDLKEQVIRTLSRSASARAIVTLPTGAGKTRLMVDTLLNLPEIEKGSRAVIWVAQHEELCEQAVACFSQVWGSAPRSGNRPLQIQRVWRGLSPSIEWGSNVIIGTPDSLPSRLRKATSADRARILATVIDEAHNSLSESYNPIFSMLRHSAIFGLTATPRGYKPNGFQRLRERYDNTILVARQLGANPVSFLQSRQILAIPNYVEIETGISVSSLVDDEKVQAFGDISNQILGKLGESNERNACIISHLLEIDRDRSVLCFAASVRSARAIAAALALAGRTSRSVDSEGDVRQRAADIAAFKKGSLQFLINYGVLAIGFDAPRVDCLIIARPTMSPVLLEQMLGRGLRGPANGGTAACDVVYFKDDFETIDDITPKSYQRFMEA